MLDPNLKPLFNRYNSVLKPLIAEYESRNENFVTSLLIDLSYMFDCVALYENSHNVTHIDEAFKHLENAIYSMRIGLVGSMMERIEDFKSRFPKRILMILDNGNFYGKFHQLEKEVREIKYDDLDTTYSLLKEMEAMIANAHQSSSTIGLMIDKKWVVIVKWVITVIVALFINFIILKIL